METICQQLGVILGGSSSFANGVCTINRPRNRTVWIMGRPSQSTLFLAYTFESFARDGSCLCLAELALLEHELSTVCKILAKYNIPVSAIHNHWIYTSPTIMYLHAQTIDAPLQFASKMRELTNFLN